MCALGAFSCRYQADTVAAIAVRKAWVRDPRPPARVTIALRQPSPPRGGPAPGASAGYVTDAPALVPRADPRLQLKKVLEERALREAGGPRIIDVTEAAANPPAKCAGARSGGRGAGAPGAQDGVKEAMSTFCQRMEVLMGQLPTLTA